MARATENDNHGWDFLEIGKEYQYKEDWLICTIKILENNSTDEEYNFKVKVLESNEDMKNNLEFIVFHNRKFSGVYSGMSQFYKKPEYVTLPIGKPWPFNYREDK